MCNVLLFLCVVLFSAGGVNQMRILSRAGVVLVWRWCGAGVELAWSWIGTGVFQHHEAANMYEIKYM